MGKLIQEAALDDRFNTQMKKIQDGIDKLGDVLKEMTGPGSMHKPTATQRAQLRYAKEDLEKLWKLS